ncbi:MAG: hypothetical protein IBX44_01665 [Sulfurospirillum sp.]|nr:hypothetical protein [Sulfurospirillum sp.]
MLIRIIIFVFLTVSFLFSAEKFWDHQHRYILKKDELANLNIATSASKGLDKIQFFFRWTLFVNDRVTVLVNNQGYPKQFVLYKKRSLDSAQFKLMENGSLEITDQSLLLLVLQEIDASKNEVSFDVFIKDPKKRIMVDFETPQQ